MTKQEQAVIAAAMRWFAEFMNKGRVSHTRYYDLHKACLEHAAATCTDYRKAAQRKGKK